MSNHKPVCEMCGKDIGWTDHDVVIFVHVNPAHPSGLGAHGWSPFDLCDECAEKLEKLIIGKE